MIPQFKAIEVIIVFLVILAVVSSIFGAGAYVGSNHVQKKWDREKLELSKATEKDRSQKQDKSDIIDEKASQEIQDLMIKNAKLQRDLDAEIIKPDYDCVVPESGRVLLNNAIRTDKR